MAVRIVLKRSSIPNKRPSSDLLQPGEVALNTNALTPGLFFEADNNQVIKVGPTAVGLEPPVIVPSLGETFYNQATNSLSIGTYDEESLANQWKEISSPWLGGTNGFVVFVAPEFPTSTDSITNNGQSAPFKTVNRAVLEIGKESIVQANENDRFVNNRFTIVVAPGLTPVYNGPGRPVQGEGDEVIFDVNFDLNPEVTPEVLQQFNPTSGGVPIPRGTSVQGFDLRKTVITPTHVPTYVVPGENVGVNQEITSILRWTGNSFLNDFTFKDKVAESLVSTFKEYQSSGSALFVSEQPHGFGVNDKVFLDFAAAADRTPIDRASAGVQEGYFYTYPVSVYEYLLSYTPITPTEANYVERSDLPEGGQGLAFVCRVIWEPYSHHRLRTITSVTKAELAEFYVKVQKAFPTFFVGQVDQAEVINPGETEYVAPVEESLALSSISNQNANGSPYVFNVSVRSSYGLCGVELNADEVTGFRSVLVSQFTCASIQNDPNAYEVYTTVLDPETGVKTTGWFTLAEATWNSLPVATRPENPWLVPKAARLEFLNATPVSNIRYYYQTQKDSQGKSYGLADLEYDFRHFGFRARNGGFMQVDTGWTVGTGIGFWALDGSKMTVTNSSSNFGSIAIRTEGFRGIGTLGGAYNQDSGFTFAGIRMPEEINPGSTDNYDEYSLGAAVQEVVTNPLTGVQTITLGEGFEPVTLLPYSLAPQSAIWIQTPSIIYRAFFMDDGNPTCVFLPSGGCQLRVRAIDSTVPDGNVTDNVEMREWLPPYIKRFQDVRTISQQSYSLILENTQSGHKDPVTGNILRLQQQTVNTTQATVVRPGLQFDPGPTGGWGRVFQVAYSQTSSDGDAPQYNETLLNRPYSTQYYVALTAVDNSRPWLPEYDQPHGAYITYQNRNWYATCNDEWEGVYYNSSLKPRDDLKLLPDNYNSPFALTSCLEVQPLVEETYQGEYGEDPLRETYPKQTYFRGSQPIRSNYDFSDYFNQDNGTNNFGLLRHNVPGGVENPTTRDFTVEEDRIQVANVTVFSQYYNPKKTFVVVSLTDADPDPFKPQRIEYCQVVGYDLVENELIVLRGLYGTFQESTWPVGTEVRIQNQSRKVDPRDYDKNWAPSKYSMIRFLQIMGYTEADINQTLIPRLPSSRNLYLKDLAIEPKEGYALNTGPWGLEFNSPSTINCTFHQFHSVGYFNYSRGLPSYQRSNINTKQYYDFLSTVIWGGYLSLFGQNETGQTVLEGDLTQAGTGRPYGSFSSEITNYTRIKVDSRDDGDPDTNVRLVDTGTGLTGGPITDTGVISLLPASDTTIGGVRPGFGLKVQPSGVLDIDGDFVGTVSGVTAGIGLGAPNTGDTIVTKGTIDLLPCTLSVLGGMTPGEGLTVDASGVVSLVPPTLSTLGGVLPGTGVTVSATGALSILPPSADKTTIGGVKQGRGILIDPDGTISVSAGPSGVYLLDNITFNGTDTDFNLTVNGNPYSPLNQNYLIIAVGGVIQQYPQAYTLAGSTIRFTAAPPAGAIFYGIAFG